MSLIQWIIGFIGILFVRFLLENISSRNNLGIITSDVSTLLHYSLFYLGLILSIVLCLKIFVPLKITDLTKLSLFVIPIIWLPPIIDLFFTLGGGLNMSYHFQSVPQIFNDFYIFFGNFNSGITIGIRIELIIILLGILFLVYKYSKNIFKALLAILLCYTIIFIWLSAPSIVYLISDIFKNHYSGIYAFITESANQSIINNNILQPGIEFTDLVRKNEMYFNTALIQIYVIIISLLLFLWAYINNKKELKIIIKNSRPRRILFYLSFIVIGVTISIKNFQSDILWNWLDITSLMCLIMSFYYAWMFSVGINDIVDKPIDKISNSSRPLITESITESSFKNYNLIFLLIAIISAYAVSPYALFFVLIFIFSYYIYSSPPLKIKRVPIVSTFLISLAALSVTMASFYVINVDKNISAFPTDMIITIIITVTLIANIKDLKDYHGDKSNNITTLPTKYGLEKGKKIISLLTFFAFIITPITSERYLLLIPSIIGAIIAYFLINKKNYQEKNLFYLFFFYIILILI